MNLRRIVHGVGIAVVGLLLTTTLTAQELARFTVVSIRPSADNDPGMVVQPVPNGYSGRKIPVIALLTSAYGLSVDRVIGAPQWPDRYDIQARYEPADPAAPSPRLNLLLQSLLRDRFGLVAHTEKRNLPVYFLRVARTDRRLGPELKASAVNCADPAVATRARAENARAANGSPACGAIERPDAFIAGGMSLDVIANALRIPAGRPVIDDTGLSGTWETHVEFAPLGDTSGEKTNVFTALPEQLGLKLESGTAPLDVLVVDSMTKPTPN
jgi:uncharacterized protein (TIGR03435 family)